MANQKTIWRAYRSVNKSQIPVSVHNWLADPGSLTQRLKSTCSDHCLAVKVLEQKYSHASLADATAMNIQPSLRILVRKVHLLCHGTPWVYAHSIIPETSFQGPLQRLKYQGNKSLGDTLFADPSMRRGKLEVTHIPAKQHLDSAFLPNTDIWGRRSIFLIANHPIMVAEYFLPQLFNHAAEQAHH